ncbi:MAG: type II secretion system protein [Myxococcaceae bacterium]
MRHARGFTLIELLVTTAVMGIIMTMVLGALIANQRQYVSHADVADIQSNLRIASIQLNRAITRAGYGVDPNFAVETRALEVDGTEVAGGGRDGSGPNGSDELVVHFRDPLFSRRIASASSGQITLDGSVTLADGEEIDAGQRLMVVCEDGSAAAYVTAKDRVEGATTTVNLDPDGPFPFRQQDRLDATAGAFQCLSDAGAFLTRVERRHFYVALLQDPIHGGGRPALMLSRGLDLDGDGTFDERPSGWPNVATDTGDAEVIALDVEQLQLAYAINRPNAALATRYALEAAGPDSDDNWVYGDDPGVPEEAPPYTTGAWAGAGAPNPLRPPELGSDATCLPGDTEDPTTCGYGGMRRYLGHVGNIRSIRFALGARSPRELQELAAGTALQPNPNEPAITLENLAGALTPTRHRRQVMRGSTSLRNVFQRKHFPPPVDSSGQLNVAGG